MTTTTTDFSKAYFRHQFRFWTQQHPDGILGELRSWLEEVHDQCLDFSGSDDPPIEETEDIPYPLFDYLNSWEEHDGETFSYREANIEEDIGHVEELIEELGEQARLDSLPKPL
jgi:hypothetical protein